VKAVWHYYCRICGGAVVQVGGRRRRYCDDCLRNLAIRMRRQRQGGLVVRRLAGVRRPR
jgi:hypothetical protein